VHGNTMALSATNQGKRVSSQPKRLLTPVLLWVGVPTGTVVALRLIPINLSSVIADGPLSFVQVWLLVGGLMVLGALTGLAGRRLGRALTHLLG